MLTDRHGIGHLAVRGRTLCELTAGRKWGRRPVAERCPECFAALWKGFARMTAAIRRAAAAMPHAFEVAGLEFRRLGISLRLAFAKRRMRDTLRGR